MYCVCVCVENMLNKIKVLPLAAESLGTRSMCTFVETKDIRVVLDAGVSLAPLRFRLPPHPKEYEAIRESRKRIEEKTSRAEVVTISHYHFDHHTPSFTDWVSNWSSPEIARKIYENKLVLLKNYKKDVNFSQRKRGWMFAKTGGKYAKKLEIADGKTFQFGDTVLRFSEPVFHGSQDTSLGWVLTTTITCDEEKVIFAPDVQGPMYGSSMKMIINEKPQLLIIGGPPLYLAGFRVEETQINEAIEHLKQLVTAVPFTILEHHLLRAENWREQSKTIFETAQKTGHTVVSAAEFLEKEDNLLEARRKQLFDTEPPGERFMRWSKTSMPSRKFVRPPI
jgi:predicted metallo-beta-lactamase superfamily hydrolase